MVCAWATSELLRQYHDEEWGVPQHDDGRLFELLVLEGAQAGLSWETVLRKREAYRRAFDGFDIEAVAGYGAAKLEALLADPGIIRHRLKLASAVGNARACLRLREEVGSLDAHLWRFVDGRPRVGGWRSPAEVPSRSPESDALSRDLRRRGFTFVGPTICYAFMQAAGLVNDHTAGCFRHVELG